MVRIYYSIVDGKIEKFYDPVEVDSVEEDKLSEELGSMCDDRQNCGHFDGFVHKNKHFLYKVCKIYIKWYEKVIGVD